MNHKDKLDLYKTIIKFKGNCRHSLMVSTGPVKKAIRMCNMCPLKSMCDTMHHKYVPENEAIQKRLNLAIERFIKKYGGTKEAIVEMLI